MVARHVRDVEVPSSSLGTPTTSLIRKTGLARRRFSLIVSLLVDYEKPLQYVHVVIPMFVQW